MDIGICSFCGGECNPCSQSCGSCARDFNSYIFGLKDSLPSYFNMRGTNVCNVKVKNIRPAYKNLKEWMEDSDNVYIGRSNVVIIDKKRFPNISSPFCNPYKEGKDGTLDQIIQKYEIYIRDKIDKDENLKQQLIDMYGKNLGCWCKPEKCHGDILVKIIDELI